MHGDYETHPEHATPLHGGCDGIGVRALHDSGQCGIVDFIELRVGSNELFGTDVNGVGSAWSTNSASSSSIAF